MHGHGVPVDHFAGLLHVAPSRMLSAPPQVVGMRVLVVEQLLDGHARRQRHAERQERVEPVRDRAFTQLRSDGVG